MTQPFSTVLLPEGQAFSLWAFWRDTLYSSLKERVGRWAPFPPPLCGLPDWCVWSDAFPEQFQPQRSRLAAAKDMWERALNPNKLLGPWWISWVSSSHPLFFLTLVSVCKQSTHRILWLSHHCWFLMGQWLLRMSCKVLGVVESQAKRGHFELGRAKTSVRALSVVRGWNPLDLTSLLWFVDCVRKLLVLSEVAPELPVRLVALGWIRAPAIPIWKIQERLSIALYF